MFIQIKLLKNIFKNIDDWEKVNAPADILAS
jgi:hypothetical protein